jgi:hypothetical protein
VARVDANVDRNGTRKAAQAYLEFLYTPAAQALIAKHHYRPRLPQHADAADLAKFPKIELVTIDQAFGGWAKAQPTHFGDGGTFSDASFTSVSNVEILAFGETNHSTVTLDAQAQEAGFRALVAGCAGPFRAADCAEKNGVGLAGALEGFIGQRRAVGVKARAADKAGLDDDIGDQQFCHAAGLSNDFGADAVTGQEEKGLLHGRGPPDGSVWRRE